MSRKVKLGEIASFQTGPFGTQLKASEYSITGTPIINVKNIGYGNLILNDIDYVPDTVCSRLSNHLLKEGDIVFGRKGSVDRHCYIKEENENWMQGSDCIRVRVSSEVNARYISYYLMLGRVKKQINNASIGSTMASINTDILKTVEIILPCLEKQNLIVDLLSVVDEKIENNNRVNSELESMAKTIYDYWFLQFDFPDENGKPYKSSGGKMVWNEELKREIPEGWKIEKIKDCTRHINTGLNPRNNFVLGNGDIKYVTVKNLTVDGTIDFSSCDMIDERAKEIIHKRSDVSKGDILFASIAPLGRCCIVQEDPKDWDINESVFSIRPDLRKISCEYLYLFFMSSNFVKKAEHSSTGSVFSGIRISVLEDMYIVLPSDEVNIKFKDVISDLLIKKYNNQRENQELISLRDFLLPLLMNGQIGFK